MFAMGDTQDLDPIVGEIERFLADANMTPTRFGQLALNDSTFVHELRRGRECRRHTRRRVRQFMQDWRERQDSEAA